MKKGREMSFKEVSTRVMDVFGEEEPLIRPIGVKPEPAAPADFTNGLVYACKDSGNMQFALFGNDDTGRYETLGGALKAVSGMKAIQQAIMDAAVAYPE